jgi:hypothetical protein
MVLNKVAAEPSTAQEFMNRRQFLKAAGAIVSELAMLPPQASAAIGDLHSGMQYRTLGHTGEKVSIVGLGGYHIGRPEVPEEESKVSG